MPSVGGYEHRLSAISRQAAGRAVNDETDPGQRGDDSVECV